jgi:ABC-type multidrug transport system ATPase subunit
LTINKGLTIIIGYNGAGKSTLLHLLATALFPDGGEITYFDKSLHRNILLIHHIEQTIDQLLESFNLVLTSIWSP